MLARRLVACDSQCHMPNPYDNATFTNRYVQSQADPSRNWYEWKITHPVLSQAVIGARAVLDYGCGSGIFTVAMARDNWKWSQESGIEAATFLGTDASQEILRYSEAFAHEMPPVNFQCWNGHEVTEHCPGNYQFDRILAKLVFNYIDLQTITNDILPSFRKNITDDGLMAIVVPNPLREADYSRESEAVDGIREVTVGGFEGIDATTHHHSHASIVRALADADFGNITVLPLPDVRRTVTPFIHKEVLVANPTPLLSTINTAKRWIYAASPSDSPALDDFVLRYDNFLETRFPEIADVRSSVRQEGIDSRVYSDKDRSVYTYRSHLGKPNVIVADGVYAESLTAGQKLAFSRQLRREGLRAKP